MHPKDAEGIANSVDPDQTAPLGKALKISDTRKFAVINLKVQQDGFSIE